MEASTRTEALLRFWAEREGDAAVETGERVLRKGLFASEEEKREEERDGTAEGEEEAEDERREEEEERREKENGEEEEANEFAAELPKTTSPSNREVTARKRFRSLNHCSTLSSASVVAAAAFFLFADAVRRERSEKGAKNEERDASFSTLSSSP